MDRTTAKIEEAAWQGCLVRSLLTAATETDNSDSREACVLCALEHVETLLQILDKEE